MSKKSPALILLMGVSGSGKTTVGRLLAERLGGSFLDADEYHPQENVGKMAQGVPLDDQDRWPWLDAIVDVVRNFDGPRPVVLGCSALKEAYRQRLRLEGDEIVFLQGSYETIESRLAARSGHFMPANLLQSQLDSLEEPARAIVVSVLQSPHEIVDQIVDRLTHGKPD